MGAGHNGLACAAYLARAGKRVLVLESRSRVGGACTIEVPFPGVRMSPCAYLAGLLHPLVVAELNLPERGFAWTPAVNGLFVPFLDGSSVQLWDDDAQCEAEIRAVRAGRRGRLARDERRAAPIARRAASSGRRRSLDRRVANARADRGAPWQRRRSEARALRLVDGGIRRALPARRAPANRVPRPGRDWDQREPFRSRNRQHPLSSCVGAPRRNARHVGLREGRHGDGVVLFLRRRARGRRGGRSERARDANRSRRRSDAGGRRIYRSARRDLECRPAADAAHARLRGRSGVAQTRRRNSDRRLHREAQRAAPRAAEFHRAAGHRSAAPLRADQRAPHESRVEGRVCRIARAANCPSISGASCIFRARTTRRSPARGSTP